MHKAIAGRSGRSVIWEFYEAWKESDRPLEAVRRTADLLAMLCPSIPTPETSSEDQEDDVINEVPSYPELEGPSAKLLDLMNMADATPEEKKWVQFFVGGVVNHDAERAVREGGIWGGYALLKYVMTRWSYQRGVDQTGRLADSKEWNLSVDTFGSNERSDMSWAC